jgi:hypothetical protein
MVASKKHDGGLYVIEHDNTSFIYILDKYALKASYDL